LQAGGRRFEPGRLHSTRRTTLTAAVALVASVAVLAGPVNEATAKRPEFSATMETLDRQTRQLMIGLSWHSGCPVPLRDLRLIHMIFWGFDDRWHRGEMVTHRWFADEIVQVFHRLYDARFPIRRMRLVDRYGADDQRSMAADNTSAFNCRWRAGLCCTWSQHAYGRAIDVNPVENPYVYPGGFSPDAGRPYLDRSKHRPGMIHLHDRAWWIFHAIGWEWGGTWKPEHDYQHFSVNDR
jgi:hypothetical protein